MQLKKLETEKRQKIRYFQNVANKLRNDNVANIVTKGGMKSPRINQILSRKNIIEKKKEDLERRQHIKEMEAKNKVYMSGVVSKTEEDARLKKEADNRSFITGE